MTLNTVRTPRILVTGSCGLIGTALRATLESTGYKICGIDLRGSNEHRGDIRYRTDVERAMDGCTGIVHLAAISRVTDGERYPEACWTTNVEGTRQIVDVAQAQTRRPWLIYASSREIYGQPACLPVTEDAPRAPVNLYGRSKVAAEDLVTESSLQAAIVRFSNVYGSTSDHADRVVPAFARQAVEGRPLRVDGRNHAFDFTHLSDTIRGISNMIEHLEQGGELLPLHLVTGKPTTLGELATMAIELAGSTSTILEATPRTYDVDHFHGDATRANRLLGWQARISVHEGLSRLIDDFRVKNVKSQSAW